MMTTEDHKVEPQAEPTSPAERPTGESSPLPAEGSDDDTPPDEGSPEG